MSRTGQTTRSLEGRREPSTLTVVLESDVRELTVLRRRVRRWAPRWLSEEQVEGIELIVTELAANAVAASTPGHAIEVCCRSTHAQIVVEVTNHRRRGATRPAIPSAANGVPWSGLRLVESFSDRVTTETPTGATTVRCYIAL